jgi:hypothetical protein
MVLGGAPLHSRLVAVHSTRRIEFNDHAARYE